MEKEKSLVEEGETKKARKSLGRGGNKRDKEGEKVRKKLLSKYRCREKDKESVMDGQTDRERGGNRQSYFPDW